MRIALVCDWYRPRVGGIERHLELLAGQLRGAGHAVTVVTSTPGPAESGVVRLGGGRVPVIGLTWTPGTFVRLGEVLRGGEFDVVHVHASMISPAAYVAIRVAAAAGLPAVLTLHSIWGGFRRVMAGFDRCLHWTRWPVVFSAVSERAGEDLRKLLPAGTPVRTLPNAIDLAAWPAMAAMAPVTDRVELAAVMRLAPRKRGMALLRMARGLRGRVRLRIAGDGPERGKLARRVRRWDLEDTVELLGAIPPEAVKRLLCSSHLFVLPTTLESFGIAALEARAIGLPVVAMRASGVGEWLAEGEAGLLAEDDAAMERAVERLVDDEALRERIAFHNRAVPVEYTWERARAAHEAVYAEARELVRARQPVRT